jgi:hypothetical protein
MERALPTDAARCSTASLPSTSETHELPVAHVALDDPRARELAQVVAVPRGEVVQHGDLVAAREELAAEHCCR